MVSVGRLEGRRGTGTIGGSSATRCGCIRRGVGSGGRTEEGGASPMEGTQV